MLFLMQLFTFMKCQKTPDNNNEKATQQTAGQNAATVNLIDKQDVLKKMRICERTLQRWRSRRLLSYYKIGGRIYYQESDLEKLLEMNRRKGLE